MKPYLLAVLGAFSLSACAQTDSPPAADPAAPASATQPAATASAPKVEPGSADERARDAIRKLNPHIRIEHIDAAPLAGFREVIVGGQTLYVSDDGRYMLQGSLYDMDAKRDLSEASLAGLRRDLLKTIPVKDRIVFSPPNPKYTVAVFTDVECGYCRKLHSQIDDYNREGIAVQYLAFPRMGLGSADFQKMVNVWCASDRKQALTDAKNDRRVPTRNCTNPVTMEYDVGQRIGLAGTPLIVAPDGTAMPGYMPPKELRAALDKLAARATGAGAAGSR
ncbi:DsbC family protein [Luteimonas soli]|uniref:Thiol:disulfide interchange protein n=1 Tax=Luteimonas soli TaxID=1648966 RepID=A0ABV7XID1_9GAMM